VEDYGDFILCYSSSGRLILMGLEGDISKTYVLLPLRSSGSPDISSHTSNSVVTVKIPASHFINFRLKDREKNMRNISPFCKQKALDGIGGKVKNASHLKNGTLLTEVQNDKKRSLCGNQISLDLILSK
jgi:hypothetical protein